MPRGKGLYDEEDEGGHPKSDRSGRTDHVDEGDKTTGEVAPDVAAPGEEPPD